MTGHARRVPAESIPGPPFRKLAATCKNVRCKRWWRRQKSGHCLRRVAFARVRPVYFWSSLKHRPSIRGVRAQASLRRATAIQRGPASSGTISFDGRRRGRLVRKRHRGGRGWRQTWVRAVPRRPIPIDPTRSLAHRAGDLERAIANCGQHCALKSAIGTPKNAAQ